MASAQNQGSDRKRVRRGWCQSQIGSETGRCFIIQSWWTILMATLALLPLEPWRWTQSWVRSVMSSHHSLPHQLEYNLFGINVSAQDGAALWERSVRIYIHTSDSKKNSYAEENIFFKLISDQCLLFVIHALRCCAVFSIFRIVFQVVTICCCWAQLVEHCDSWCCSWETPWYLLPFLMRFDTIFSEDHLHGMSLRENILQILWVFPL